MFLRFAIVYYGFPVSPAFRVVMMKRLLLLSVVVVVVASGAHAAYLFDWSTPSAHMLFQPDPTGDPADGIMPTAGADIYTGIWWGMNLTTTYFRMDLAAQPVGGSADIYGIYVHDNHNSLDPSVGHAEMPGEFAYTFGNGPAPWHGGGIDWFITSRMINGFFDPTLYVWNGGPNYVAYGGPANGITFNSQSNGTGGWSLEWALSNTNPDLPYADLALQDYHWWGATLSQHNGVTTSLDIAPNSVGDSTPEPTTMALLGLGLGGLWLRRRKK
jgi:hypothetical protein